MASPHIAGIAALISSKNPTWSPTADQVGDDDHRDADGQHRVSRSTRRPRRNATPLDYGAGHVRPAGAFDPGLVYDSGPLDWLQYACGIGAAAARSRIRRCATRSARSTRATSTTRRSRSVTCAGKQTITRTVTNVDQPGRRSTSRTCRRRPASTVKVADGADRAAAALGRSRWRSAARPRRAAHTRFGSLTWADLRGHAVRSPIAVKAVAFAAPPEVAFAGTSGTRRISVTPGFTGTLNTSVIGLVPATVTPMNLDTTGPTSTRLRRRRRSRPGSSQPTFRRARRWPGSQRSTLTFPRARTSTSSSTGSSAETGRSLGKVPVGRRRRSLR